jgi:hypothetical protein
MSTRKSTSQLAIIVDTTTSTTYIYIGEAARGTATSAAEWFIQRINKTNGALIEVANNGEGDQIWDNRVAASYSL